MDVLGLLWYVFFLCFCFLFSRFSLHFPFFWEGNWDEKGWIDGGREEGENEREVGWKRGFFGLVWFGLNWTGLALELYCSIWLSSRKRGRGRERVVLFFSPFFSFFLLI